eukprot:g6246.t1
MKSTAVAVIGALCCGASMVGAFVVPVGRSSGSSVASSASRRSFVRRASGLSMMSSVATPPPESVAPTQEPERRSNVQAIRSNDDYVNAIAQHEDKLVVIKFYDQFCRACDEIRPRFEDLSRSLPEEEAIFFQVEFSESKDLCKQLGIRRLPTVQIYDGAAGRVADLPSGPSRFADVEERFAEGIDNLDTAVIDEDLIGGALVEEADGDQHISSMTTFELAQVVAEASTLRLSYKNVLKIDNLQGFSRLTKLCLDNNIIESISNLDHLVHLKWLDLSFNNIKAITGLDRLTELLDLSLYNNQISEIEGLDSCSNLQCLSLGNNRIASLDSIIRLRRYPKLQLVNLEGNPVCREVEYRFTVLAYIKNITYHDYGTVDPAEVLQALEEEQLGRERASESETELLRRANLLVTKTLFSDMFEADAEMSKLKYLPGVDDMTERYRTHVQGVAESYRTAGLANASKKEEEVKLFDAAVKDLRQNYARRSIEMIENFARAKKKTFNELSARESIDPGDLLPLQKQLEELESALMDLEMYEVEQHEQLMGEFEVKYTEFKNHCFEMQHNFFRAVEEHEEGYFNSVAQLAQDMLEKVAKNELPEDVPDELSNLLIDRDTCMNVVVGSHDIHVGKLLGREDETRAAEIRAMTDIIENRRREERTRNRNRMLELRDFVETNNRQIADLISSKLLEDYDEADGM